MRVTTQPRRYSDARREVLLVTSMKEVRGLLREITSLVLALAVLLSELLGR